MRHSYMSCRNRLGVTLLPLRRPRQGEGIGRCGRTLDVLGAPLALGPAPDRPAFGVDDVVGVDGLAGAGDEGLAGAGLAASYSADGLAPSAASLMSLTSSTWRRAFLIFSKSESISALEDFDTIASIVPSKAKTDSLEDLDTDATKLLNAYAYEPGSPELFISCSTGAAGGFAEKSFQKSGAMRTAPKEDAGRATITPRFDETGKLVAFDAEYIGSGLLVSRFVIPKELDPRRVFK